MPSDHAELRLGCPSIGRMASATLRESVARDTVGAVSVDGADTMPSMRIATDRATWLGLAAVMLPAVVLSFAGITSRSLWFDEAMSVRVAQFPREAFINFIADQERFNALYYTALRGWLKLGDSELVARMPSALAAVATVGLAYLVGRRLFGPRAAIAGAAVLAAHALLIQYAQEARTYALAVLFVTAASWILLVAVERRSFLPWAGYGVVAAVAVYAHFYAAMVVAAHVFALVVHPRRSSLPWAHAVVTFVLVAAASWPLAQWLLASDQTRNWIPPLSIARVVSVFAWLGGANGMVGGAPALVLAAIAIGVVVAAAIYVLALHRRRTEPAWPWVFALAWVLVPIIGGAIASIVVKPVLAERYTIVALPGFALLVGALWSRVPTAAARSATAAAIAAVLAVGTANVYATEMKKPQWQEAVAIMAEQGGAGDAVIVHPGWQWVPLDYALRQPEPPLDLSRIQTNPGVTPGPDAVIDDLAGAHERVWLLIVDGSEDPSSAAYPYLDLLGRDYKEAFHASLHRLGVYRFDRVGGS
jgi:mannosyltransferase